MLLFQGNVVCQNCILTELDLSAFLDGNGQLSVEATVCIRELFMKKVACQQALRGDLAVGRERKESLQLRLWNLNNCIEKVGVKC